MTTASGHASSVAIVGGGLAGLAAGCALSDAGFRVTLLERRPYLGGRASSYQHPGTGEVVDNCQHVLLGCCTNLIDFYRRIGAENQIRWYDRLVFLEPGGRASVISPSWLPAPLHTAPSFLKAASLSLQDKSAIARAMVRMMGALPPDGGAPFLDWLRDNGQTRRAIDRFWKVVLVSALNEELDRVSTHYAIQVFRESFLKSAAAGRMGVPVLPLSELYAIAGDYITRRGGEVRVRASVESFHSASQGVTLNIAGQEQAFSHAILATPFDVTAKLLGDAPEAKPLQEMLAHFGTSPITGIHFWFDRQISDLDHAVLLDRTIQWMFHKSRIQDRTGSRSEGSYVELVVSSSKTLVEASRQEILDLALRELCEFFPAARDAKVLKSAVIKEIHATYSPAPGADLYRPRPATPWPNVFLSGDWTATGWPATMEGAVRAGYLSAEALCRSLSQSKRFLVPDLPATGLMRWLAALR